MKRIGSVLCLAVLIVLMLSACAPIPPTASPEETILADFRDIQGITAQEIAAVEQLQARYPSFRVAMMPNNTEFFLDENGQMQGYSVMLCAWLTDVFEIPFIPAFYDWPETLDGLADHSIDFTGEITATPERRAFLYMTDSISERTIKAIRKADSKPLSESTAEHPVRCCFLEGANSYARVSPHLPPIDAVFAESLAEVLALFVEGKIDAFIVDSTAESVFEQDSSIIAEDFSPVIYSPVSLSTQNPELVPIIDLVQRMLESDDSFHFSRMYREGYAAYLRHKLSLQLTPDEKQYLRTHVESGKPILYTAESDNYPVAFYNTYEQQWQGASYDMLAEIAHLTGLTLLPANAPGTAWANLLAMLKSGEAQMASELLYSVEREGSYLWAAEPYLSDYYALLSTSGRADVNTSDIAHFQVGLVSSSAYADFFHERFPEHKRVTEYATLYDAVHALESGEIDLLMGSRNALLNITNTLEKPGFRINIAFTRAVESYFGFNTEEALLRDIISKAQRLVDTRTATDRWQRTVFDYQLAIARERLPLVIGLGILVSLTIALLVVLVIRSRRAGALLEKTVQERTKALEAQTNTNRALLDYNPFSSLLFDENYNILDCNLSAQIFFKLTGNTHPRAALFDLLLSMVPVYQPDGRKSIPFSERLMTAFMQGHCEFDTTLIVEGRRYFFNVIMRRVLYSGRNATITYLIDVTAEKQSTLNLKYNDALLAALGDMADLMLLSSAQDLEATMFTAFSYIGQAAAVDRVYIWKNHTDEDGLTYTSQLFEWSPHSEPQQGKAQAQDVLFDDMIPNWRETLQKGACVNTLVKNMAPQVITLLMPQEIVSLLLVPIFMQENFWGFIGFDDCHTERTFTDAEISILRICGFMSMVISDTIQNEVATHLLAEREAALITAQIKANFLANMSHEIRTPMNAIQGMTELILHEDISDTVLSHVTDIRSASRGLLAIINDILDISKIESGKLEIVPLRYYISSLLMDVISIIKTRADKNELTFVVHIDAQIPCELIGDELRIKQILLNLLTNAVKFTREGQISLSVQSRMEGEDCRLIFAITDTGIGIRQEDIDKIFVMFQQIDTRKNRNIEGTGLGLSISKQLAEMMDGSIAIESTYGVGSTFTVDIRQSVANPQPVAALSLPERNAVLVYENRPAYLASLTLALEALACSYDLCVDRSEMYNRLNASKYDTIFVSALYLNGIAPIIAQKQPEATVVVLNGENTPGGSGQPISITMPIHCLQLANIFNHTDDYGRRSLLSHSGNITAPDARVLVVDDNAVNLKVAAGLLSIYMIQADTATSGLQAIRMVKETDYDLVFMDHMMPEMDGIDATVTIRRLGKAYERLPIIALTANAVSGMREMFKAEGLDDFLPKPIEMSKLDMILKKWLPKDKQQVRAEGKASEKSAAAEHRIDIAGLHARQGLANSGGILRNYQEVLAIFASDGAEKLNEVVAYHQENDIRALTICVHALKSAAANIGAENLSAMAASLEAAGKVDDTAYLDANLRRFTDTLAQLLDSIRSYLRDSTEKETAPDKPADQGILEAARAAMMEHMRTMDVDAVEEVLLSLRAYRWDEAVSAGIADVQRALDRFDYDGLHAALAALGAPSTGPA